MGTGTSTDSVDHHVEPILLTSRESPSNNSSFDSLIAELSHLTTSSTHRSDFDPIPETATTSSDSAEGFYSVTSSRCSSRSLGSQTDNMSDLIITTGHEDLYQQTESVIDARESQVSDHSAMEQDSQESHYSHQPVDVDAAASHAPTNAISVSGSPKRILGAFH